MRLQLLTVLVFGEAVVLGCGRVVSGSQPTHVNALPLERDGDLNKDFRRELILGPANDSGHTSDELLRWFFSEADEDHNNFLDFTELHSWINGRVKQHFVHAAKNNFNSFLRMDKNHNGRVSWEEFAEDYLMKQGYSREDAERNIKNLKGLPRKLKEQIMLDRAAWFDTAYDPNGLNIDEFLQFRHPEHSHVSLLNMVTQIISDLDTDGDGALSEDEFASVESTEKDSEKKNAKKRAEFQTVIDANHDGKATLPELISYNDPSNPLHAKREAQDLIRDADVNRDGRLSLREVLQRARLFLGSKAVNTAQNLHEEF